MPLLHVALAAGVGDVWARDWPALPLYAGVAGVAIHAGFAGIWPCHHSDGARVSLRGDSRIALFYKGGSMSLLSLCHFSGGGKVAPSM